MSHCGDPVRIVSSSVLNVSVVSAISGTSPALLTSVGAAVGAGNNTLVAAPGSGAIYVYSYALQGQGVVNAKLQDGAGGIDKTALWHFQAREGVSRQVTPLGYLFKCTAATLLNLNLSAAVEVDYEINYWVE